VKLNVFAMSAQELTLWARDALALGCIPTTTSTTIGHVERVAVFTHV
jgi:hypothetical protein